MQKYRPIHPQDLEILKKRDREYSAYILASWLLLKEITDSPVTLTQLEDVCKLAKETSQDCYLILFNVAHKIPLHLLDFAIEVADVYRQDMLWRFSNLAENQLCYNGFDQHGFNKAGRNVLFFIAEMRAEVATREIEVKRSKLESLFKD